MKRIRRSGSGPPKIEGRSPGAIHPYEALAAAWFLLYLTVPLRSGDDEWFYTVFHHYFSGELIPFLDFRYHSWSTRLILEALTLPLIDIPLLYRLSVPLWGVAIAGAVQRISGGLSRRGQWMLCLGLLLLSPMPFSRAAASGPAAGGPGLQYGVLLSPRPDRRPGGDGVGGPAAQKPGPTSGAAGGGAPL